MGKWIGWRVFPPKSWWTGKKPDGTYHPVLVRDPIAHALGATAMLLVITLMDYIPPQYRVVVLVGFIAALRQEWLVEMFDGGYKAWRALWCTLVNIFTVLLLVTLAELLL
jgi:hypothetical protein